jgi:hypothetical protein
MRPRRPCGPVLPQPQIALRARAHVACCYPPTGSAEPCMCPSVLWERVHCCGCSAAATVSRERSASYVHVTEQRSTLRRALSRPAVQPLCSEAKALCCRAACLTCARRSRERWSRGQRMHMRYQAVIKHELPCPVHLRYICALQAIQPLTMRS